MKSQISNFPSDAQLPLDFDVIPALQPGPVPHLRDEIARVWGLPLGVRVEITFRPAYPVPAATGILELRAAPDFPWDPHRPLALRIAGCDLTTRDIERWSLA